MKRFSYIFGLLVLLSACAKQEPVDVQNLNKEFISAWNNEDADKVISYFAEDVDFVQGEIHYSGKAEVADKWVHETIGTISDLKTNVVSTGTDAATAYEAGTFSVDVLPLGPEEPEGYGEGNFMLLWKKTEDGTWKLAYAQLEDLPVRIKN